MTHRSSLISQHPGTLDRGGVPQSPLRRPQGGSTRRRRETQALPRPAALRRAGRHVHLAQNRVERRGHVGQHQRVHVRGRRQPQDLVHEQRILDEPRARHVQEAPQVQLAAEGRLEAAVEEVVEPLVGGLLLVEQRPRPHLVRAVAHVVLQRRDPGDEGVADGHGHAVGVPERLQLVAQPPVRVEDRLQVAEDAAHFVLGQDVQLEEGVAVRAQEEFQVFHNIFFSGAQFEYCLRDGFIF